MVLTKFYSGFRKSEGCVVLVKIKSKGKVTPRRWGRGPPPFWFGWQPLWPVGVFSSWSTHRPISESAHRAVSSPKQKGNVWERWKYENNQPEEEKIVGLSGQDESAETIFDSPATHKSVITFFLLVHFYEFLMLINMLSDVCGALPTLLTCASHIKEQKSQIWRFSS